MPARELVIVDEGTPVEEIVRQLAEMKAHNKSLRRQLKALLRQVHEARTEINVLRKNQGQNDVPVTGDGVQCPKCNRWSVAVFPTRYKTIYVCKNDKCKKRWLGEENNGTSSDGDDANVL